VEEKSVFDKKIDSGPKYRFSQNWQILAPKIDFLKI